MEHIVILTGAGISAESGLGTFRDKDGLWTQVNLAEVATPEGYAADPDKVLAFYNARRANCEGAKHNAAHTALARLQQAFSGSLTLVTQNIDDLHEKAGAKKVIHMHGEIFRAQCTACTYRWRWRGDMTRRDQCSACASVGTVRPDIVWFGEMPYRMDEIYSALSDCDLFVAIGTSGAVYPAAGFVSEARNSGAQCLEINLADSDTSALFHRQIVGPASETVPAWVDEVLAGGSGQP